ncbi:MAG: thioester reductase domain-containing protein, partial [Chloroflexi bacterium]|nr:thioester reductase domain-containing protein [Chloroflexota bacterium]
FTSGSTGKPKAVDVRQRALLNILQAVRGYTEFSARGRMLALTTSSFDISCTELFLPLMAGGLVEIAEDGLAADGLALSEKLLASRPTHVQATPSTWKALLSAGWQGEKDITLLTAGEALSRELAEELLKRSSALWNLYGPTETTVYSAVARITSDPASPVRIGRPVLNTRLYILDAQRQPLPVGAIGELYIGGLGLSPGYWRRPVLTGERFLPDPFLPGERIYRTGDLARFNPTGEIICLGRADEQVKIHGVRIELGEIESNLRRLSGVQDAVVSAWRDSQGDYQLVAHVIHGGQMLTPSAEAEFRAQLRAGLRERLPEVMVPPHFLFPASFPMTANGKVQRSALPVPGPSRPSLPAATVTMPLTGTEELLAEAWADVLEIDKKLIGRGSDFMDLGGHSLLMTRLMVLVRKLFQVNFNLRELFAAPRLEQFAALIDARRQQQVSLSAPLSNNTRDAEWARQRMAFLTREAELPQYLSPVRGVSSYLPGPIKTVMLTGATGFLGAYLVAEILKHTDADLFCLVRARRGLDARQRIEAGLRKYRVWGENENWQRAWQTRFQVVEGDVTLPRLGLDGALYDQLARQVDAIFHGAAHVNFIYPYEALRATNVLGIHEIIQFAFHTRIKPVHHLSTAAIWPMGAGRVYYERDPIDHNGLLNLGYDEAKWVGEKCLLQAAERGLPVARYRPGEVGGDSRTGHCVTDHFLIAAFKGFLQFGAFPLMDIGVDVAPVDYVARAMVHLAFRRNPLGHAFHLTNPSRSSMSEALTFLRGLGYQFQELPFEQLRDRLVRSSNFSSNALFAYQAALEDMDRYSMELPAYDTRDTLRELSGSGISCPPADERLFGTYFRYLRASGFIPTPTELSAAIGAYA